ncbi:MAG: TlyA family rRNA (cytidine-2'-O)-methyltransferase [Deltaproteobacteria bacterium]|nr:MAG: TlyA family rRNA (cytidine-2'-O)-methyltransferase [Deltaproteobacteria bacterium]
MPTTKKRLDISLLDKKLAPTRQRAQALILAGKILVNQEPITKSGTRISESDVIVVKGTDMPYVSRGGIKLAEALTQFQIDASGRHCMDIGASSGGFTDCLLQNGAAHVVAVDVGYGQIAWKLRQDPRVTILERTNIRYLTVEKVPFPVDLAVIDVSFISLKIVVPVIRNFLKVDATVVTLIKPQFEVGRDRVGKGGVVKNPALHEEVIQSLSQFFETGGFRVYGVIPSPITGPKGNKEFLCHMKIKS